VVLTPSDHAVADGAAFRRGVRAAVRLAESTRAVTLFAVEPSEVSRDFGWIIPNRRDGHVARVTAFVEKPEMALAERLHDQGAVWNTMVVVGRAADVRALYRAHLPELTSVFDTALRIDDDEAKDRFLAQAYRELPPRDFSRDVLEQSRSLFVHTWPATIGWSDLGTPERLHRWLKAGAA
jgi:mannose-1-phosphate guanylyltransferase/mannose-1-phosphate guanylyltransferase/mannose-6-phosphate isomerase